MWIAGCGRIVIGDEEAGNFGFVNGDENALHMECRAFFSKGKSDVAFFCFLI